MQSRKALRRSRRPRPRQRSRRATRRCCAPRPSCSSRTSRTTRTRSAATRNWRSTSCRRCRRQTARSSPSAWRSAPTRRRRSSACWRATSFEVAAPVIRRSPVLDSFDLLAVIAATDVEHHRLIARRSDLGDDVKRALRLTGDAEVIGYLDNGPSMRSPRAPDGRRGRSACEADGRRSASRSSTPTPNRPLRRLAVPRPRPPDPPPADRRHRRAAAQPAQRCHRTGAADRAFQSILSAAQIVGFARSGQIARTRSRRSPTGSS